MDESSLSYSAANTKCKTFFGTQLATICNANENVEAVNLINQHSTNNVWIGFNDQKSQGTFQLLFFCSFLLFILFCVLQNISNQNKRLPH